MIDPLWLPDTARAKVEALRFQFTEARALASLARDALKEREHVLNQRAALYQRERAIEQVEENQPVSQETQRRYNDAQAAVAAARLLWDQRVGVANGLDMLNAAIRDWLHAADASAFETAPPIAINVENGDYAGRVEALRNDLAVKRDALRRVFTAQAPVASARDQITRYVDALAVAGRPSLTTDRGELRVVPWQIELQGPPPLPALLSMIAWLMRDQMIAKLSELVDHMPVDPNALPPAERAQRIAQLESEILLIERQEEAVVEHAAAHGVGLERRPDAMPLAILGLRFAVPAARQAA